MEAIATTLFLTVVLGMAVGLAALANAILEHRKRRIARENERLALKKKIREMSVKNMRDACRRYGIFYNPRPRR